MKNERTFIPSSGTVILNCTLIEPSRQNKLWVEFWKWSYDFVKTDA